MTLPNKLTTGRLLSAPLVFLLWYVPVYLGYAPKGGIIALWVLFLLSEVTDLLDGYIARSRNLVSDIGKLMDPFSDVFLRVTYFVGFVAFGLMPVWALIVILWRELLILFIRMLLIREGFAMAANVWGKAKSFLYFLSGVGGMLGLTFRIWYRDADWLYNAERIIYYVFAASAVAALISFAVYFNGFRKSETYKKFISE